MNRRILAVCICAFTTILFSSNYAIAVAPLSGVDFRAICDTANDGQKANDGDACATYIHGFLGGAHASGRSRDNSVMQEEKERSSFTERATRTRLGKKVETYGTYDAAGYCIPAKESLANVVKFVRDYLEQNASRENETANQLVLAALKQNYPCPKG